MRYLFPLAFMVNTFSMTVLLIVLGLVGDRVMAAEVGVVQAATLALLYAFSANARSLILNKSSPVCAYSLLVVRLVLLIPLAAASYWLSVNVAGVEIILAAILIARRCVEWLGEIHLSEAERLGRQHVARNYFLLQSVLLALVLGMLLAGFPHLLVGLFLWAALPILFSAKFLWNLTAEKFTPVTGFLANIIPNLGSTAIIGITVYVFRLLIVLLTGKETAGDLFTAYAIGGMAGSVFANALGATLALHEQHSGKRSLPSLLRHALNFSLLLGIIVFIAALAKFPIFAWTRKSFLFWEATGLSMVAGVIMVYAQRIRFGLLQHDKEHDVFGPDVLMNILIFTSVPFVFFVFGAEAMSSLYLLNAALAYVFYTSAKKEKRESQGLPTFSPATYTYLRLAIGGLLLLPLFFQMSHGVFRDPSPTFSSGGRLHDLPIPVSVLACYAGIVVLGAYRRAFVSFGLIFLTCILMVMSSTVTTQNQSGLQEAKFMLLIQFILPMIGLVLGQVYEPWKGDASEHDCAKAFFWITFFVIPIQLIFTISDGYGFLSPNLGLFAVYQHFQYVPTIFVAAYIFSLFSLWHEPRYKVGLSLAAICMAAYVSVSLSVAAIGMFFSGLLLFALFHLKKNAEKFPVLLLLATLVLSWNCVGYEQEKIGAKFGFLMDAQFIGTALPGGNAAQQDGASASQYTPPDLQKQNEISAKILNRIDYWRYYLRGITSGPVAFFLGLGTPPPRSQYPSAQNYYLDFIYNFGILALLPMLSLVGATIFKIYNKRLMVLESPALFGLCFVVIFLLIFDNFDKVSLRQPYSGVFSFFLWGLFLTKLSAEFNVSHRRVS